MNKRKLGNSGLEIFPLAFGGNVFGWTLDQLHDLVAATRLKLDENSIALLDEASGY